MSKAMTAASKEQLVELMQYLSQNISVPTIGIGGGFAPIGTIISYMGTTAPQDYLICDGQTYNIADYKQLSDFFAAQFGSANFFGGDGVTTFKVPDLRGEFLRGTGTNSHANQGSGANVGVHQDGTEFPNIFSDENTVSALMPPNVQIVPATITPDNIIAQSSVNRVRLSTREVLSQQDKYVSFTARPTNTSVLYCIKVVAAGDVYSTTERVVGTWIDGKPVFEKVLTLQNVSYDWSTTNSYGISNIDHVVSASVRIHYKKGSSEWWFTPYCKGSSEYVTFTFDEHDFRAIWSNTNEIQNIYETEIILRYTKTTDTPV